MEYYCLENIRQFLGDAGLDEQLADDILDRAEEMEDDDGLISGKYTEYIFDDEVLQEEFETALETNPDQIEILDGLGDLS